MRRPGLIAETRMQGKKSCGISGDGGPNGTGRCGIGRLARKKSQGFDFLAFGIIDQAHTAAAETGRGRIGHR